MARGHFWKPAWGAFPTNKKKGSFFKLVWQKGSIFKLSLNTYPIGAWVPGPGPGFNCRTWQPRLWQKPYVFYPPTDQISSLLFSHSQNLFIKKYKCSHFAAQSIYRYINKFIDAECIFNTLKSCRPMPYSIGGLFITRAEFRAAESWGAGAAPRAISLSWRSALWPATAGMP